MSDIVGQDLYEANPYYAVGSCSDWEGLADQEKAIWWSMAIISARLDANNPAPQSSPRPVPDAAEKAGWTPRLAVRLPGVDPETHGPAERAINPRPEPPQEVGEDKLPDPGTPEYPPGATHQTITQESPGIRVQRPWPSK